MTQRPLAHDGLPHRHSIVVGRYRAGERFRASNRAVTHGYAALAFYTSGNARIEQRGEWRLAPGDALLIPAGEPHRMLAQLGAEYWGLGFFAASFATHDERAVLEPFDRVRRGAAAVTRIPSARHAYLETLFGELEQISAQIPQPDEGRNRAERCLLTLISDEVRRSLVPRSPAPPSTSVVTEALGYIERHCLARLTLTEVASALNRSPAYVTTALTRATGRTAIEWITSGRMAEARRLLLHSSERIETIAERVGYADPTHFIRVFRRAHGVTPAQWRARTEPARS